MSGCGGHPCRIQTALPECCAMSKLGEKLCIMHDCASKIKQMPQGTSSCGYSKWPWRDKQTQPCCVCHDFSVAKVLQRSAKPSCACWRCSPTFFLLVGDTTPQGHPVPAPCPRALGRRCLLHPAVSHFRRMRVKALTASAAQVSCDLQSLTCPVQFLLLFCFK